MNDRYLFRGQRIDIKEWVYGYYFKTPLTDENSGTKPDDGWLFLADGKDRHCISDKYGCAYVVIPETVGLWTTLKDKNGKLIFENDIVKGTFFHAFPELNFIGTIFWHNDVAGFGMNEWDLSTIEVIGNIHQNRELLEKGGK